MVAEYEWSEIRKSYSRTKRIDWNGRTGGSSQTKIKTINESDIHIKKQEIAVARDSIITYQELFDAAKNFEENPEARSYDWIRARKFVDWKNLHNLPVEEVQRRVIGFLNDWHCRLPVSNELAENIKQAYRKSIPFLKVLENETIEDFEFEKRVDIDGKEYTNRDIFAEILENFCRISYMRMYARYNLRSVCALKILSLINPYLFVMWDTNICDAYGIKDGSNPHARDKQYLPEFIPLMKQKANGVIDSYMKDKKCTREEAVRAINNFGEWRPLAKLLDEYNWKKYVLDKKDCS